MDARAVQKPAMDSVPLETAEDLVIQLDSTAEDGYYSALVEKFAGMPAGEDRCQAVAKVLKTKARMQKFQAAYVHHLKCKISPLFGQRPEDATRQQVRDVMYSILMNMVD